jgi:hypothetical protein
LSEKLSLIPEFPGACSSRMKLLLCCIIIIVIIIIIIIIIITIIQSVLFSECSSCKEEMIVV